MVVCVDDPAHFNINSFGVIDSFNGTAGNSKIKLKYLFIYIKI